MLLPPSPLLSNTVKFARINAHSFKAVLASISSDYMCPYYININTLAPGRIRGNLHPPTKNFFRVQSTRLADPFESLNSCLAQSAESYGVGKATENCCFLGRNQSMNISYAGSQSVKSNSFPPPLRVYHM